MSPSPRMPASACAAPAVHEKEGPVTAACATWDSDLGAMRDSNICSACPTSFCAHRTHPEVFSYSVLTSDSITCSNYPTSFYEHRTNPGVLDFCFHLFSSNPGFEPLQRLPHLLLHLQNPPWSAQS